MDKYSKVKQAGYSYEFVKKRETKHTDKDKDHNCKPAQWTKALAYFPRSNAQITNQLLIETEEIIRNSRQNIIQGNLSFWLVSTFFIRSSSVRTHTCKTTFQYAFHVIPTSSKPVASHDSPCRGSI